MDDELLNNDVNMGDDTLNNPLDPFPSSLDIDITSLQTDVVDITPEEPQEEHDFDATRKMCPTRHGCQGATDCDYCGGDYPG